MVANRFCTKFSDLKTPRTKFFFQKSTLELKNGIYVTFVSERAENKTLIRYLYPLDYLLLLVSYYNKVATFN